MYTTTKTNVTCEGKEYATYGIKSENVTFDSVFCDKETAETFCRVCNELNLDEMHIKDVIEDFLCDPDLFFEGIRKL